MPAAWLPPKLGCGNFRTSVAVASPVKPRASFAAPPAVSRRPVDRSGGLRPKPVQSCPDMSASALLTRCLPGLRWLPVSHSAAPHRRRAVYSFYVFGDSLSRYRQRRAGLRRHGAAGAATSKRPFLERSELADQFAAEGSLFTSTQTPLLPGSVLGNVGDNYAWGGARTYGHSDPALNSIAHGSRRSAPSRASTPASPIRTRCT